MQVRDQWLGERKTEDLEKKTEPAEEENGKKRGCFFPDTRFAPGRRNMLNFLT